MENQEESADQGKNQRVPTPPPIPETPKINPPFEKQRFVSRANCHKCRKKEAQRTMSYGDYQRWIACRRCVIRYCEACSLNESSKVRTKEAKKLNQSFKCEENKSRYFKCDEIKS